MTRDVLRAVIAVALVATLASACGADEIVAPEVLPTGAVETGVPEEPPELAPATTVVELRVEVAAGSFLGAGSPGDAVRVLQQALAQLGFDPGPADGEFGPRTETAVKAFQRSRNLEPDGLVGPETAQAINDALAEAAGGSVG